MALIGRIRRNSWLLVAFIGLGLALFIITSMFVGNQIPFLDNQSTAGTVNGEKIEWNEFLSAEDALYRNSGGDMFARRSSLWNFFIENILVEKEANKIGLGVSDTEMDDLQFGQNLSPIVAQRFQNPQTRQVDRAQLDQIRTLMESGQINPEYMNFWEYQKKEIRKDRLQTKLGDLVSKSIYTPTWMVERTQEDQNSKATFRYVRIPFDDVDNSEVEVSDADYKAYIADHKAQYMQDEETRKVEYIVFDVEATRKDSMDIRANLATLKAEFATADNDATYAEGFDGQLLPGYYTSDLTDQGNPLNQILVDTLFSAPIGTVVGPYLESNGYVITKLVDRRVMPDSADSRHILVNATTPQEFAAAEKKIDSLKNLIETGVATFDSLAIKFSQDPGSASKGGIYENTTPNQFVTEYNDLIFFEGEIGKLYAVRTQFGIHLIEPLKRKYTEGGNRTTRVKVATIARPIVPSDDTQQDIQSIAQDFMAANRDLESFRTNAASSGYTIETSAPLKANDYVVGAFGAGSVSRDIVRWAFSPSADVNDVAPEVYAYQDPVLYYDNRYVVIGLKNVQSAGVPSIAGVKEEIQPLVYNLKKGEVIKGKINGQDLSAIASSFNVTIDTSSSVGFNQSFVSGLGNEPQVMGAVFNLAANGVSQPIVGNSGVFIVQLLNKTASATAANIPELRRQTSNATRGQVRNQLIQGMKEGASIDDNRSRVY